MSTNVTIDPQATVRMDLEVLDSRYRLEGVVASGGAATVVRATDLLLDRPVAVKLLKETTHSDEDRARFLVETQTLARLSHAGLVTVLDAGTADDRPYLVMELVDGPSMSAVLGAPMDLELAADIGAQVAGALHYAHSQGVVHRDVKPGNVLLRSDGRVKLADFGIARLIGQRSEYTKTGVVVGSVHYLAPEQVAFEEITPAVDVYALGMLLIRAVTGQHAFDGPTIETALARLSAAPEVPADLPSGWRTLLTAMTARRPEDRPTAAQVAERLMMLTQVRTTAKALPPLESVPSVPSVRAGRLRRLSPVALVAAVLAIALYVAASLAGGPGEVPGPSDLAAASETDASTPDQVVRPTGSAIMPAADVQASPAAAAPTPTRTTHHRTAHARSKAGPSKHQHQHHKKPKHPSKHKGKHKGKPGKGKH